MRERNCFCAPFKLRRSWRMKEYARLIRQKSQSYELYGDWKRSSPGNQQRLDLPRGRRFRRAAQVAFRTIPIEMMATDEENRNPRQS